MRDRELDAALRRRPCRDVAEADDQDRYYDGNTSTVGALSAWTEDLPWTDNADDREAELR